MLLHTGMMDRGFTAYILSSLLSNTLTYFLFTQHKKGVIHLGKRGKKKTQITKGTHTF